MANEQEAGSIIIALRAQIEGLQKGMAQAKTTLENFAKGVQTAATGVQRAGQQMNQTFGDIDKKSALAAARFGRFTQRLLAFHLAMSSVAESARRDMGAMRTAIEAVSIGFGAFAAITSILPGKLGIVLGIIAALTLVITKLAAVSEDTIKAFEAFAKTATDLSRKFRDMDKEAAIRRRVNGLFGIPPAEVAKEEFDATKKEIEDLLKFIEIEVPKRLDDLDSQLRGVRGGDKQLIGRLASSLGVSDAKDVEAAIQREIEAVENAQQEAVVRVTRAQRGIGDKRAGAQIGATRAAVQALNAELEDTAKIAGTELKFGLIDPLQAAEMNARAAEKAVRGLIEEAAAFERATGKPATELGTAITAAADKARKARELADRQREVQRQATNFGGAIGEGITAGVLEGLSAMETLARIGGNLMENALRDAVSVFQDGMTAAFKAITGVAGVELGGIITGLVGIAGAILSKRGDKGSDSFASIQSNIESSQAVRGIVAGPSNVAIAAVGENIQRAFEPARQLLAGILSAVQSIDRKAGRGGPGGASLGFAGSVPTT